MFRSLNPPSPPKKHQSTHSLHAPEKLSRIDHILGYKWASVNFRSTEIILNIFSDHSGMKLEISDSKRNEKKLFHGN